MSIVSQTLLYVVGSVLVDLASLVLLPVYLNALAPGEMGVLELCITISMVMTVISSAGMESAILRIFFDYKAEKEKRELLGTGVGFALASSLVIGGIFWFVAGDLLSWAIGQEVDDALSRSFVIFFTLRGVGALFRSVLRVNDKAVAFLCSSIANALIGVGLAALFILRLKMGAEGALLGRSIGTAVGIMIMAAAGRRNMSLRVSPLMVKGLLSYGGPLILVSIVMWTVNHVDRVMQPRLIGLSELGMYAIGLRLASVMRFISEGVRLSWPSYAYGKMHEEGAKDLYVRAILLYIGIMLAGGAMISLFAEEAIVILGGKNYRGAYVYIPLFIVMFTLMGTYNLVTVGLTIQKMSRTLLTIAGVSAMAKIVLTYAMGLNLGGMGIALAATLSVLIMNGLAILFSKSTYSLDYPWRKIVGMFSVFLMLTMGSRIFAQCPSVLYISLKLVLLLLVIGFIYGAIPDECQKLAKETGRQWKRFFVMSNPAA